MNSAIYVLKQSNYLHSAFKLGQVHDRAADVMDIMIEDLRDGLKALKIIQTLPFDQVIPSIISNNSHLQIYVCMYVYDMIYD